MIVKRLRNPARISDSDVQKLKKEIMAHLTSVIYEPLIKAVPALTMKSVKNSKADALAAIKSGLIVFHRGQFKGTFTSTISRGLKSLGAEWDSKTRTWKIPLYSLPPEYRKEISLADITYAKVSSEVMDLISDITHDANLKSVNYEKFFDTALLRMDDKVNAQIDAITVAPQLTEDELNGIAKEYSENLNLYVKDFTNEEILSLRKKVEQNFYSGNRYENLVETIKKSYGVSDNKAQFLARQETNLLTAEYHKQRFTAAGSEGYRWRCVSGSPKHPVRPAHKLLDGKWVTWSDPPIVDPKKGRKAHAGVDFGCRCTPEVEFRFS